MERAVKNTKTQKEMDGSQEKNTEKKSYLENLIKERAKRRLLADFKNEKIQIGELIGNVTAEELIVILSKYRRDRFAYIIERSDFENHIINKNINDYIETETSDILNRLDELQRQIDDLKNE